MKSGIDLQHKRSEREGDRKLLVKVKLASTNRKIETGMELCLTWQIKENLTDMVICVKSFHKLFAHSHVLLFYKTNVYGIASFTSKEMHKNF